MAVPSRKVGSALSRVTQKEQKTKNTEKSRYELGQTSTKAKELQEFFKHQTSAKPSVQEEWMTLFTTTMEKVDEKYKTHFEELLSIVFKDFIFSETTLLSLDLVKKTSGIILQSPLFQPIKGINVKEQAKTYAVWVTNMKPRWDVYTKPEWNVRLRNEKIDHEVYGTFETICNNFNRGVQLLRDSNLEEWVNAYTQVIIEAMQSSKSQYAALENVVPVLQQCEKLGLRQWAEKNSCEENFVNFLEKLTIYTQAKDYTNFLKIIKNIFLIMNAKIGNKNKSEADDFKNTIFLSIAINIGRDNYIDNLEKLLDKLLKENLI